MPPERPEPREPLPTAAAAELAMLVAELFADAPIAQRVRLLNHLLRPVGPLALVCIAAGAFGSLLPAAQWRGATARSEHATRFSTSQVLELARYVEQKSPESLAQLPALLADSPW